MKNNPLFSLNPSLFRAFLAVAEHKSFTAAADSLFKTQSSVSRQVQELESKLGVALFNRNAKNVEVTEAGQGFIELFKQQLDMLDKIYGKALNEREGYSGKVKYSMPPSCLLSPHFPMILDKRKEFPELEITVELSPNESVFQQVLNTQSDFGFVTEKINNPALKYQAFCQEEYILVGTPELVNTLTFESIAEQKYVSYPGMDSYFDFWQKHFNSEDKFTKSQSLYYAGHINVIEGAITMVKKGVGLSVFPAHCIALEIDSGELAIFNPNNAPALLNWIYIIQTNSDIKSKRVDLVIDWFLDLVKDY